MIDQASLQQRIGKVFEEKLNLAVPSVDTDLFDSGGLDSLSFVELLLQLELEYGIKIPLADLELDNFRSIGKIAGFVAQRLDGNGVPAQAPAALETPDRSRPAKHG
jgi:acyl carrier protein